MMRLNSSRKRLNHAARETNGTQECAAKPGSDSFRLYLMFAILRVFLVIVPQYGYIHPDELIQSVEVVGGQILKADVETAWEFNCTNPIRSMNIPFLLNGTPIWMLRYFSALTELLFDTSVITPFTLLICTRFVMCLGSFLVDYSMYKICKIYARPYKNKLAVLATSYVMLVYGTRTFSNTIELILFSVLLWMIAACMHDHQLLVHFRNYLVEVSNGLETATSRVKHLKVVKSIQDHSLQHCFLIASLIVFGCYNRPTFVVYGVGPVFFWIHRGLSSEYITVSDVHTRMFMFLLSSLPLLIVFVLSDSFYFGYLSISEIINWDITLQKFVFPPWNFIKYNLQTENLEQYGIHARYLHFLVNIPLLFGTLGIVMFGSWASSLYRFIKRPSLNGHSRALDLDNLMQVSIFVPVALLSLLPHQEPRFIIPVLMPLTFLYGDRIYNISRNWKLFSKQIFTSWLIFNGILTVIYGLTHQGGVLNLASYMHTEIESSPPNATIHLFTSHMYNFPRVLLNQPNPNMIFRSMDGVWFQKRKRVFIHEQRSKSMAEVVDSINRVYTANGSRNADTDSQPLTSYVAIPSALTDLFEKETRRIENRQVKRIDLLYPHLSTEIFDKPETFHIKSNESTFLQLLAIAAKIFDFFTVTIYRIG